MAKWGKEMKFPAKHLFWERLEGKNRFCFKAFRPDEQVNLKTKEDGNRRNLEGQELRRSQLNFCYAMHGTLECRLFPGFATVKECQSAVEAFINCVESYLDKTPDTLMLDEEAIEIEIQEEEISLINI